MHFAEFYDGFYKTKKPTYFQISLQYIGMTNSKMYLNTMDRYRWNDE